MAIVALLWLLLLPALLASLYLAVLAVAAKRPADVPAAENVRFEIVVPAHDEEAGIARTVRSLLAIDWPRSRFGVTVVADNCSDATASRAREAGAFVLERNDPARRGKGYALAHAFAHGTSTGFADAFVVVDADTVASPRLLAAFAARLGSGEAAVQARYGVLNPHASWRTGLMALAFALVNDVRSLGRERLRLSCGLRGNGMCFSVRALDRVPYDAFSIVEDAEYGIRLGEAGIRVAYAGEVAVLGEMVSTERAARSQRRRWEAGRRALRRERGGALLREALRRRSLVLLDLALDLSVPTLSSLLVWSSAATAAAGGYALHRDEMITPVWGGLLTLALLGVYVMRGWAASGLGAAPLRWIPFVPVYVLWKLGLRIGTGRHAPTEFVRTTREGAADPEARDA